MHAEKEPGVRLVKSFLTIGRPEHALREQTVVGAVIPKGDKNLRRSS